jgi:hypothetical protein
MKTTETQSHGADNASHVGRRSRPTTALMKNGGNASAVRKQTLAFPAFFMGAAAALRRRVTRCASCSVRSGSWCFCSVPLWLALDALAACPYYNIVATR